MAVHPCRACFERHPELREPAEQIPADLVCPDDRATSRAPHESAAVRDRHDVGCEHVHEPLQVSGVDRRDEPCDDRLLLRALHGHPRTPRRDVRLRPVSDLPDGIRCLVDGRRDLVIGDVEHLAQHEHRPLGVPERLEHGQHGDRHALGELDVVGDIRARQQRLRQPLAHVCLAPARQGAQMVQRLAGDDPHEIRARIVHIGLIDAVPSQPGLLKHVLGVRRRPEHLVGGSAHESA